MTKRNAEKTTNHQVGEQVKQHHIALLLDIHANGLTDENRAQLNVVAEIYAACTVCDGTDRDCNGCGGDRVREKRHD